MSLTLDEATQGLSPARQPLRCVRLYIQGSHDLVIGLIYRFKLNII